MNLYAVVAMDAPDGEALRLAHLGAHLAHVEASLGHYAVAGPLKNEAGTATGSLLVIKADTPTAARAFFETDPYYKAGLWSSVTVHSFAAVAGDWVGGKTW